MRSLASLLLACLCAASVAHAQQAGGSTPRSVKFTELESPQPTESGGGIEVVEFFWYSCPHCYTLEPLLEAWERRQPADVRLRRVPAVFNDRWAQDAAIFYALEALGTLERLHRPLFDAIHRERLRTDDKEARDAWLRKNGVDAAKFEDALRSFGVQNKVKRAAYETLAYKISGTPAFAVQGRYTVSTEQGGSQEGMLESVDYLVGQLRKQR